MQIYVGVITLQANDVSNVAMVDVATNLVQVYWNSHPIHIYKG